VERELRRIFGFKRKEVIGRWRKLHNEKLHNLYSTTNMITMIKLRKTILAGRGTCVGEIRNFKGREYFTDLRLDGRAILK
jgi:hypothetical protein